MEIYHIPRFRSTIKDPKKDLGNRPTDVNKKPVGILAKCYRREKNLADVNKRTCWGPDLPQVGLSLDCSHCSKGKQANIVID